jgi:hypothetical protein
MGNQRARLGNERITATVFNEHSTITLSSIEQTREPDDSGNKGCDIGGSLHAAQHAAGRFQ